MLVADFLGEPAHWLLRLPSQGAIYPTELSPGDICFLMLSQELWQSTDADCVNNWTVQTKSQRC